MLMSEGSAHLQKLANQIPVFELLENKQQSSPQSPVYQNLFLRIFISAPSWIKAFL